MSDESPSATMADTTTKRHAKYYLKDGNVEFELDDGTLYNVHRHFFETYSTKFAEEFLSGGATEGPVKLSGVSGRDFDRLLSLIYPTAIGVRDIKTADEWLSVLRLATKWSFTPLRDLAFAEFTPIASPIDNIVAARELDKPECLLPALVKVCAASKWLTLEEAERLGMKTVVEIGRLREEMRKGPVDVRRALIDAGLAPRLEEDATGAENAASRHGRNGSTSLASFLSLHADPPSYNSPGPRSGRVALEDMPPIISPPTPPGMYEEIPFAPSRTSVRTYSTYGRPPTPPPPPGHIAAPRNAGGDVPRIFGDQATRTTGAGAPRIFGGDAPRVFGGEAPRTFGGEAPRVVGGEGSRNPAGQPIFGLARDGNPPASFGPFFTTTTGAQPRNLAQPAQNGLSSSGSHGNSVGGTQKSSDFLASLGFRVVDPQGQNAGSSQGINAGRSQGFGAGSSQSLNVGSSQGANASTPHGANASTSQGFNTGAPLPAPWNLFSNACNTNSGSRFP